MMIGTNRELPHWFYRAFAAAAIFLLAGLPGAVQAREPARFDHSGVIMSPGEYTHTVKCDPGDVFDMEITSSHPVGVSVFYKFPYDTEWLYRLEQISEPAASHRLRHAAPSEKPAGPMKYWHYEVRVSPMTSEKTDYSLSVIRSEAPKEASGIDRYAGAWRHAFSTPDGKVETTLDFNFADARFTMTSDGQGMRMVTEFSMSDIAISDERDLLSLVVRAQRAVATGDGVPDGRMELTPNEAMKAPNPTKVWINSQGELYVQIGSDGKTVGPYGR